jgi:hypothetical protein
MCFFGHPVARHRAGWIDAGDFEPDAVLDGNSSRSLTETTRPLGPPSSGQSPIRRRRRGRESLPVPCRRYCGRPRGRPQEGFFEALPYARNNARKWAGDIADLKTCNQHDEFKKRAQQVVLDIIGSDENRGEDERARRD